MTFCIYYINSIFRISKFKSCTSKLSKVLNYDNKIINLSINYSSKIKSYLWLEEEYNVFHILTFYHIFIPCCWLFYFVVPLIGFFPKWSPVVVGSIVMAILPLGDITKVVGTLLTGPAFKVIVVVPL